MKPSEEEKTLEYYLALHYSYQVRPAEEGGFMVTIPDLPGCIAEVEAPEDAYTRIEEVKREWIRLAYDDSIEIPLPREKQPYSGKFLVRVTKSLHRGLAEQASREGVSLNHMVSTILAAAVNTPTKQPYKIDHVGVPNTPIRSATSDTRWSVIYESRNHIHRNVTEKVPVQAKGPVHSSDWVLGPQHKMN
jgi:antitoxin HicB